MSLFFHFDHQTGFIWGPSCIWGPWAHIQALWGSLRGPLGAAHGDVLSPIHSGGLQHAALLPLRGFGLWVLWLRAVLGLFLGPQGRHMGVSQLPYARAASIMRVPFLSEALIQNLNLLSQKLQVLWLRAVLGLFLGPLGAAHGGVLGPLRSGSLHHAVSFPFRGFQTKFEPSISKTLVFMAWGCFGAVLGTLRGGTWGCPRSLTLGQPPPCSFLSFQRL